VAGAGLRTEAEAEAELRELEAQEKRWPIDAHIAVWTLQWILGRGPAVSATLQSTAEAMQRFDKRRCDPAGS
jgi:hypothetical protein